MRFCCDSRWIIIIAIVLVDVRLIIIDAIIFVKHLSIHIVTIFIASILLIVLLIYGFSIISVTQTTSLEFCTFKCILGHVIKNSFFCHWFGNNE
ncbi:hypothetical protein JOM56_000346 [Amanita muscaria]